MLNSPKLNFELKKSTVFVQELSKEPHENSVSFQTGK